MGPLRRVENETSKPKEMGLWRMPVTCALVFALGCGPELNPEPSAEVGEDLTLAASNSLQEVSSIDLVRYFPKTTMQKKYRDSLGHHYSTYTYLWNDLGFKSLYSSFFNLGKTGSLGVWAKQYAGQQAPATYAHIFFGTDRSTTEVGDYFNLGPSLNNEFILFGYRSPSTHAVDGLRWAHPGGKVRLSNLVHPYAQDRAGEAFTFESSDTAVLVYAYIVAEKLSSFRPMFGSLNGVWKKGNGATYNNVLHLIFYHGSNYRNSVNVNIDCSSKPGNALKAYYSKVPGFNTYVSEYYLAEGQWIIQERTLYIEDASFWRANGMNLADCSGGAFDPSPDGSNGATYVE